MVRNNTTTDVIGNHRVRNLQVLRKMPFEPQSCSNLGALLEKRSDCRKGISFAIHPNKQIVEPVHHLFTRMGLIERFTCFVPTALRRLLSFPFHGLISVAAI